MHRPWTWLIAWLACPFLLEGAVLTPVDVAQFFVAPDEPAVLRWRVAAGAGIQEAVEYTVRDYTGKAIGSGRAVRAGEGPLEATVRLARGMYEIELPAVKERFGIVALPAWQGEADPFFSIDGALSWLVGEDGVREGLVRAARRMGIRMIRERLTWGAVHPARDRWDEQTTQRFKTLRQACAKHGVEVLEMAHDGPAWMGRVGVYPEDLAAAARSWQELARRWRPTWGALEVWNEPDIFFGANLPADQYAPLVKAIAYGLTEGKTDVPLVGGVMAHCNRAFLDTCTRSRLLGHVDAFSFHNYGQASQLEGAIGQYHDWLGASRRADMPLWMTECGRPWQTGPERPPADQDSASALDIIMKGVEARACGIARYFPFVYPYYVEDKNNFGMMDKQATPLRSIAAYAQSIRALGRCDYLGDLRHAEPALRRARVFGDPRSAVAVLYTGKVDTAARVKIDLPALRVEGIDGRALAAADGSIPVPDGLVYVWVDRERLGGRLLSDTPAMRFPRGSAEKLLRRRPPGPIVLRYQFDAKLVAASSEGYRIQASPAGKMPLVVRAFNLSEKPRQATLSLEFDPAAGTIGGAAARTVEVPPRASVDVPWETDLSGAFDRSDRLDVTVQASPGPGERADAICVVLFGESSLTKLLGRFAHSVQLPIQDLKRWTPSIVARGTMRMESSAEAPWRLSAKFADGDRWAYPLFRLPEGTRLAPKGGLVVRARCHKPAVVRVILMEGDGDVSYLAAKSLVPADGQWHVGSVRFADLVPSGANTRDPNGRLDLDQVRRVGLGLNSQSPENTLEVSDVYVVE